MRLTLGVCELRMVSGVESDSPNEQARWGLCVADKAEARKCNTQVKTQKTARRT